MAATDIEPRRTAIITHRESMVFIGSDKDILDRLRRGTLFNMSRNKVPYISVPDLLSMGIALSSQNLKTESVVTNFPGYPADERVALFRASLIGKDTDQLCEVFKLVLAAHDDFQPVYLESLFLTGFEIYFLDPEDDRVCLRTYTGTATIFDCRRITTNHRTQLLLLDYLGVQTDAIRKGIFKQLSGEQADTFYQCRPTTPLQTDVLTELYLSLPMKTLFQTHMPECEAVANKIAESMSKSINDHQNRINEAQIILETLESAKRQRRK